MPIKRYQKEADYSYALGVATTLELLCAKPELVSRVYLHSSGGKNDGVNKVIKHCSEQGIEVTEGDKLIEKLSVKDNCYAVGVFQKTKSGLIIDSPHVVLAGVRDMGNLGTIIRTMIGFGFYDLAIIRPAADIYDPKVIRSSVGAFFKLNFEYFNSYDEYLEKCPSRATYTFMLSDNSKNIRETEFSSDEKPISLIFGSESHGLGREFEDAGTPVRINHNNDIDSLNLSVAVGIALFYASR